MIVEDSYASSVCTLEEIKSHYYSNFKYWGQFSYSFLSINNLYKGVLIFVWSLFLIEHLYLVVYGKVCN